MGYETSVMWGTKFGNKIMFKVYGKTDNQVAEIDLWISDGDMNWLSIVSEIKDRGEPWLIGYTDTENFIVIPDELTSKALLGEYQRAEKKARELWEKYAEFTERREIRGNFP